METYITVATHTDESRANKVVFRRDAKAIKSYRTHYLKHPDYSRYPSELDG